MTTRNPHNKMQCCFEWNASPLDGALVGASSLRAELHWRQYKRTHYILQYTDATVECLVRARVCVCVQSEKMIDWRSNRSSKKVASALLARSLACSVACLPAWLQKPCAKSLCSSAACHFIICLSIVIRAVCGTRTHSAHNKNSDRFPSNMIAR